MQTQAQFLLLCDNCLYSIIQQCMLMQFCSTLLCNRKWTLVHRKDASKILTDSIKHLKQMTDWELNGWTKKYYSQLLSAGWKFRQPITRLAREETDRRPSDNPWCFASCSTFPCATPHRHSSDWDQLDGAVISSSCWWNQGQNSSTAQ